MAGALALLGTKHALLVSSEDGLDELSISAPTIVVEVVGDEFRRYTVSPEEVGLERAPAEEVPGGDPEENAQTARAIFAGEAGRVPRPGRAQRRRRDLRGRASGRRWPRACGPRVRAIDDGAAAGALERFVRRTRELAS